MCMGPDNSENWGRPRWNKFLKKLNSTQWIKIDWRNTNKSEANNDRKQSLHSSVSSILFYFHLIYLRGRNFFTIYNVLHIYCEVKRNFSIEDNKIDFPGVE